MWPSQYTKKAGAIAPAKVKDMDQAVFEDSSHCFTVWHQLYMWSCMYDDVSASNRMMYEREKNNSRSSTRVERGRLTGSVSAVGDKKSPAGAARSISRMDSQKAKVMRVTRQFVSLGFHFFALTASENTDFDAGDTRRNALMHPARSLTRCQ